ncbi:MAG: dinitrogenase iron-molybdenum cofactor biosynthesis protein [Desulfovibrio sp.]|nr:dinitrogenase iron-molybdenum cofactor biosynthesis protein [Desulfovibrio sp.]
MASTVLAIPSNLPGGLDAERSAHFGHCEIYTIVKLEGKEIKEVTTLEPVPHTEGGCLVAVQHLGSHGVTELIAGGMGMRPLMGFTEMGIKVYYCPADGPVRNAVNAYLEDKLPVFSPDNTCQHHH